MRRFWLWITLESLLFVSVLWTFALCVGCTARYFTYRAPQPATPLDCKDLEQIHVPPGCSMEKIPDGIKVTCDKRVTVHPCEKAQ